MSARKWYLTLVLALALLASACGPAQTPAPTQPPAAPATQPPAPTTEPPPTEPPAERKVAEFIWTQEFDTLNLYYSNKWFSQITEQIWNAWAWEFDENNEPFPVLVAEIPSVENGGISEDGTVITMKLRDDITWSDGTPITSADFVFTYEMVVDPNNIVASTYPYDQIASVEAPDDQTVVITFNEPFAPWLATLWHSILPRHVLQPVFDAEGTIDNAEWTLAPTVGAGPFVFAEWESGSFARFTARDDYWGGRPKIDEIFIRFVPDDASQTAALRSGDADVGTFPPLSDVPALKDAGVNVIVAPSGYNEGWYFNLGDKGHPALKDVNVRKAIALAFDRFTLNQELLLDLTQPPTGFWDAFPAYTDPSVEVYPFDAAEAARLLDEAGWTDSNGDGTRDKDGVELVLRYFTTTREIRQDTQAVAQQQLAEVGIGLDLQSVDSDLLFAGYVDAGPVATGEYDIAAYSDAPAFPDPDREYWLCDQIPSDESPDGTNWQFLCDEELDALFKQQLTQVSAEERQATFHQITKHMYDNVYWLGLWQDPDYWLVGPRLSNVSFSGATPLFSVDLWELTP
jgi:peptide/nickel transport system substrate-binding protein